VLQKIKIFDNGAKLLLSTHSSHSDCSAAVAHPGAGLADAAYPPPGYGAAADCEKAARLL
jgi:hypothetical protein